ncbi:hypothetical protein M422DRAFT_785339, partial [Sphaerobolus stellatus SS14]
MSPAAGSGISPDLLRQATEAVTNEWSFNIANTYFHYAAVYLLLYDSLLTFPAEIRYIWNQKIRLGSVLYLICRYLGLLYAIFRAMDSQLIANQDITLEMCDHVE